MDDDNIFLSHRQLSVQLISYILIAMMKGADGY